MSRAPRTIKKQKEFIVEFLEGNRFLLWAKVKPTNLARINKTWESFVDSLNKLGPAKTIRQWKETISEMKTNVRRRARDIKYSHTGTRGGVAVKPLTDLEERLLSLVSDLNIQGMDLAEAEVEKENEAPNLTPNCEAASCITSETPVLIITEENMSMDLNVTFEERIDIKPTAVNSSSNPVPIRKKIVRKIQKKSVQQNALEKHDKAIIYLARSNFAIARALNQIAKSVSTLARKT